MTGSTILLFVGFGDFGVATGESVILSCLRDALLPGKMGIWNFL